MKGTITCKQIPLGISTDAAPVLTPVLTLALLFNKSLDPGHFKKHPPVCPLNLIKLDLTKQNTHFYLNVFSSIPDKHQSTFQLLFALSNSNKHFAQCFMSLQPV